MKKILMIAIMALVMVGCANPEQSINNYMDARNKVVNTAHILKCEKDCISDCDSISNDIDRIDCKATCIDTCHGKSK